MNATTIQEQTRLPKDYKSAIPVRCPGCGFAILSSLHRAMAELNIEPHETAVIRGLVARRGSYYMSTWLP